VKPYANIISEPKDRDESFKLFLKIVFPNVSEFLVQSLVQKNQFDQFTIEDSIAAEISKKEMHDLKRFAETNPQKGILNYWLAYIAYKNKKFKEAIDYLKKVRLSSDFKSDIRLYKLYLKIPIAFQAFEFLKTKVPKHSFIRRIYWEMRKLSI
jgi:hypothetical protein